MCALFLSIDPFLWKCILERLSRKRDGVIRDIYDGEGWARVLDQKEGLSLTCNTDGVSIFRSSKYEIWPIWLVVNELPPQLRYIDNW